MYFFKCFYKFCLLNKLHSKKKGGKKRLNVGSTMVVQSQRESTGVNQHPDCGNHHKRRVVRVGGGRGVLQPTNFTTSSATKQCLLVMQYSASLCIKYITFRNLVRTSYEPRIDPRARYPYLDV